MSELQAAETVASANSDGGPVKAEDGTESPAVEVEQPAATEQSAAIEQVKTPPKKRGAADKDDAAVAKKKRSPTKAKPVKAEAEDGEEEFVVPLTPQTPQTPRKRKASAAAVAPGRAIPANFEAANEADKLLVKMKDEGSGWLEIRAAWKELTGESPGASTLPNRYNRLKANFIQFSEVDEGRLQAAKIEVETKFNTEKWAQIANAMEAMGSEKFTTAIIQKKVKELEKKAVVKDTPNEAAVEAED